MKRFLLATLFISVIGAAAFVLWMRSGSGGVVELSDEQMDAARASGAAAQEIVVESGAEGEAPLPTIDDLKFIADRDRMTEIGARIRKARDGAEAGDRALLAVLLSEVERLSGHLEEAHVLALEGAEALPDNSRARHMLAKAILAEILVNFDAGNIGALFAMMGAVKDYKAEINAAVELDPSNVDARVGQVLTMLLPAPFGDKKRAAALIEEIGEHDPLRRDFWRGQIVAVDDDRLDEAVTEFERLISVHPKDPDMLLTLGELYVKQDAWAKAIEAFDRQIVEPRTPYSYRALYQGAKARMKTGKGLEEALAMLSEFEAANPVGEPMPTMDRVKFHKGRALTKLGRFDEAIAVLEEALVLKPGKGRVEKALADARASQKPTQKPTPATK